MGPNMRIDDLEKKLKSSDFVELKKPLLFHVANYTIKVLRLWVIETVYQTVQI